MHLVLAKTKKMSNGRE